MKAHIPIITNKPISLQRKCGCTIIKNDTIDTISIMPIIIIGQSFFLLMANTNATIPILMRTILMIIKNTFIIFYISLCPNTYIFPIENQVLHSRFKPHFKQKVDVRQLFF